MKSILLIGLGRFGNRIAIKLSELGHEIMAIDHKEELVNQILPYTPNAQIGDSTSAEFMASLGVKNYDVAIVAIGNDFQSSLETTSLLKELGAKYVVSRASTDRQAKLLLKIGADEIVYPERQLADWTAIRYGSEHVFDYISVDKDYSIYEVALPVQWIGKTVAEIDIRRKFSINILAVKEKGKTNPVILPDKTFSEQDTLLVLGRYRDVQKCFKL